jgi:uncharacterized Zn-finger protein
VSDPTEPRPAGAGAFYWPGDQSRGFLGEHDKYLLTRHCCDLRMESYPKFHNEIGVPMVRIGCHEFECIGDKPPQDHPHIYLNMGVASEIVCPYCSTLFRFDPTLGAREADPADCAYVGAD